ncbi:hypothetical protein GCM10023322_55230 [Rugosimonospora acidiphila]|uniref:Uncharacterized protein n=1 Tax=Rugosimonospora acidiphila TaxID=556531 RepID=A0ABP9SDA1_9ACTN
MSPLAYPWRYAVRRQHKPGPPRYVVRLGDEHRAAPFQIGHDLRIMDDLTAHVDGWPEPVESLLDRPDGALNTRTEAPWRGK